MTYLFEDLIGQYLSNNPLSKTRKDLAMPDGPRQNYIREDGTVKGQGFLGPLPTGDGHVATELSIGVSLPGYGETDIPSIVPSLTDKELTHLLVGGRPTNEIVGKAVDNAMKRLKSGKSQWSD